MFYEFDAELCLLSVYTKSDVCLSFLFVVLGNCRSNLLLLRKNGIRLLRFFGSHCLPLLGSILGSI